MLSKRLAVARRVNSVIFEFLFSVQMNEIVIPIVIKRRKDGGMHISMVRSSFPFKQFSHVSIDKWIARQMEVHPDKKPVLLVAGWFQSKIYFHLFLP